MILSVGQVSKILNVSEITIRRLVKDGCIQHRRIGDRILFTEGDVDSYLESVKVAAHERKVVNA